MKPRGLVAFDLDGTLVRIGSSWSWIHRLLGTLEAAKPNADLYHAGKIDYKRWAELDVALWHGVPLSRIKRAIRGQLVFFPGARMLIQTLKEWGVRTAIISSGLAIFADLAREELGVDVAKANRLLTDGEGRICGVEVEVAYDNKHQVLRQVADELKVPLTRCAAVGDAPNDIPMFREAGASIAFNPSDEQVASQATIVVRGDSALALLPPLRQFFQAKGKSNPDDHPS